MGGETVEYALKDSGPSRFYRENFQGDWIARVRPHTSKPIVSVGRFTNPDTMVELVRGGNVNIIGAARSSIADPFLPKKIEEGRLDEICECIGCNVCISRYGLGGRIVCTQNATTGEEYRRGWHPQRFTPATNGDRNVLVVGAGAAGMECAVILAQRGMRAVHLVEARSEVGGHLNWVSSLPGLAEWRRVVDYRQTQLRKFSNIQVITRTALDASDVLEYGAEIVIIATGSRWATDGLNRIDRVPIPGADASLPYVLTPEQVMLEGKLVPGDRILVYDCEGYFMGASLAEKLARDGKAVRLVTPFPTVAPYLDQTGENIFQLPLLHKLGVEMLASHLVTAIGEGTTSGVMRLAPEVPLEWNVDAVVIVTSRTPDDRLYDALKRDPDAHGRERIEALYHVGDCVTPRMFVADAVFDGHRLAREIDTDNPEEPLPYLRERILARRT